MQAFRVRNIPTPGSGIFTGFPFAPSATANRDMISQRLVSKGG